jgi:cytochrome c oxidase subunit 2
MTRVAAAALLLLLAVPVTPERHRVASAALPSGTEQVVRITARKFAYTPDRITLKKNIPVVLELTSADRDHGFRLDAFGVRADIKPGETTRVRIVPDHAGTFEFECDVFCGAGHEDMAGQIVVVD